MEETESPQLEWMTLFSCNLTEIREFYQSLLGVEFTEEQHDRTPVHYSYQAAGLLIELYPLHNKASKQDAPGSTNTSEAGSVMALGFSVSDLEGVVKRMDSYVIAPITQRPYGRVAFLKDPDGRKITLRERIKEQK